MILDELTFNNYGVYRGHQKLRLTPPSPDKPIVLLGGLNGGGKTTLLDGLQLALFGKNAHCSNRGELGYDEFLRRSIHRGITPQEGASIEVGFRHTTEGAEHTYHLSRSWHENGKGIKEEVTVRRDGAMVDLLSEQWSEQVETFIPLGISDLFFFDGEKIEQLADINRASRVLSTAIHSLLGIELVDRLAEDLIVLERRKKVVVRSDATRKKIEEFDEDIRRLEGLRETIVMEQASARNEQEQAEKALRKARDKFRLAGGELFAQREQLLTEKTSLEARRDQIEEELREVAGGAAPLLLVQHLLAAVEKRAEAEREAQESKMLGKLLSERDARLVQVLKRAGSAAKLVETVEQFCTADRNKRIQADTVDCFLRLAPQSHEDIRLLRKIILPDTRRKADQLIFQVEELNEALLKVEHQLSAVPDTEAIEALRQELTEIEKSAVHSKAHFDTLEERARQLTGELERMRAGREDLLVSDIDEQVKHLDNVRILKHSEKVRATLQQFRVSVVERHVSRIQHLMLDSFKQLLRKKSLVSEIRIHPATFALELVGGDGKPLSSDRLSAGERQLLAVSMLWGLARASGRPLPTIIDTPLGRLDSDHRAHLVERYFPFASHQVVLLSTNEEIDQQFLAKLKPRIGHSYRLNFDDKTDSTTIEPGYFW